MCGVSEAIEAFLEATAVQQDKSQCVCEVIEITACVSSMVSEENDRCPSLAVVKMFEKTIEPSLRKSSDEIEASF